MRPIKLKIKGINSFIEEQTIDFEKLSDRGLFGIFGPTGSGKSTVLDGITLALYGKVARESNNYINTNCESANVSFEFQISGAENKRYLVEREFKKDKKTENAKSGKCKVVDLTGGIPEVLADSKTMVDNKCKEIIGLNLDDFTRTVVLPQGKFSEFLKLEGVDRRRMLERLFNLQQYGDDLSRKLSFEINKEKSENSVLIGQLKGYEDFSEEKLKEREELFEEVKKELEKISIEVSELEKQYENQKIVWDLQLELKELRCKKEVLENKREEIESCKEKVFLGEGASKVMPYIDSYEKTINDIANSEKEKGNFEEAVEFSKSQKEKADIQWQECRDNKEEKLPNFIIKKQKAEDALKEKALLETIEKEIMIMKKDMVKLEDELEKKTKIMVKLSSEISEINSSINQAEEKSEQLKIDGGLKEKVLEGARVKDKLEDILKLKNSNASKKLNGQRDVEELQLKERELYNAFEEKQKTYEEKKILLENMVNKCPGNQNDIVALQKQLLEAKEKWNKYHEHTKIIESANEALKDYKMSVQKEEAKKILLEHSIVELKIKIKELEIENLAYKLREELKTGDVCPVCGSTDHHRENIKHKDLRDNKGIEKELEANEKELKLIEENITKGKTNIDICNENIEKANDGIAVLGDDFKNISVEELNNSFEQLKKAISEYDGNKNKLEEDMKKLLEEKHKLETNISTLRSTINEKKNQLKELDSDLEKNHEALKEIEIAYDCLVKETGITDFKAKSQEILACEKERENLLKDLKVYRKRLEDADLNMKSLEQESKKIENDITKGNTAIEEKTKIYNEKISLIKSKVGDVEDIGAVLRKIENIIKTIEDNFVKAEKIKEDKEKIYQQNNEKLIAVMSRLTELHKRKAEDHKNIDKNLELQGFKTIEEAKKNILNVEEIGSLKEYIERYSEEVSKNNGAIESVLKKLDNREIGEEQWAKLQEDKVKTEEKYKELNESKIKVEEEVRIIKEKLFELSELLKKKEKLDRKLGLLGDLEKLFKGKKFVEFVATTRLKYVSIEASKRLKEITNGNYGLEVDDNGKFLIRDNKNGGVERDASTLSGGETFLASLALALALSAEIQLKGTAPLELFFLDEGFGTLDDDLLEVVMSSLEKIHNDKLKIGLISHVESIKNRVPVKLIVTPAEAGRGGSKVRIERS